MTSWLRLLGIGLTTSLTLVAAPSHADTYPSKPIRLIVPFPASGATDLLARAIAQKVGTNMGQQIVVDNRPGAGGAIGSDMAAKAPADGYTLLIATTSTHSIGPYINTHLPYNTETDFTPIGQVAVATNVLVVPNQLPVKNVKELIDYAKKHPGELNYASSGNGTVVHLTAEAFKAQAGVFITHIPYRGTALAVPDLISNKVQVLFDSIVSGMPHVKDGKLKALAVTSLKRSPLAPDLPTASESGLPGFESDTWFGIYGPKGLPADVVTRLNAEFNKAIQSQDVRDRLGKLGAEPVGGTPAQFAAMVKKDSARWGKLIKDRKIQVD
ncbi:Tripartite-type tricarboxylate transporter, receptor component TctC [Cupriavidus sp. OV038]|uniref:Bug family tripartite tricarboxylate transporter substrate binding protein n=1 Tax=unclassified Cupriavidus TaxID=2640874 RepID=UPI0008F238D5|nr:MULTISPECIES: tripartite tricarboxylate transporter substrate binding protein [unclassified Cupriavidus]SFB76783.1 Tripartite-type tricarboxylate transporter, receptor component TctC [Cupriavidus sp. OV038]SFO64510.1 Tripartite-type tricarboxylate transporter, receptor component TctC [Cupriavidus sp. OV096]